MDIFQIGPFTYDQARMVKHPLAQELVVEYCRAPHSGRCTALRHQLLEESQVVEAAEPVAKPVPAEEAEPVVEKPAKLKATKK